ncbi:MAG: hypothetical protein ABEJ40_10125 [Haloarculaceae archaeon]
MVDIPSPFGGRDAEPFDAYDEFVPEHVPEPGPALDGHDVLAGRRHLAVHRLARALFAERGVYDMTFGYNLARLNCDVRHPDAGFRYAVETGGDDATADRAVLRAEFTPTTEFCPQGLTLTRAAFRAWNGLADRHEYDLVRVRVAPTHQQTAAINEELAALEGEFLATGELPDEDGGGPGAGAGEPATDRETGRGRESGTPF